MLRLYTATYEVERAARRHAAFSPADAIPSALQTLENPSRMLDWSVALVSHWTVHLVQSDLWDMDEPDTSHFDMAQEHISWAIATVIAAQQRSFDPGRLQQEMIRPRDRKALYARLLVSHFAADRTFMARVLGGLRRHRKPLVVLLAERGHWDGRRDSVTSLEDAILLDYDGLSTPDAFQQLWEDVEPHTSQIEGLADALSLAEQLAGGVGLRAPWTGPMILGAWLRHLVWQRILPPNLRKGSLSLWPAGPRTVLKEPPLVAIQYRWDPECETRDSARAKIMVQVDARLDETLRSYEADGYERVNVRKLRRDVEAAYLRVSDPQRWSWKALSDRYEAGGRKATHDGTPLFSPSGIRRAVGRVLDLLGIDAPKKRPGRPKS